MKKSGTVAKPERAGEGDECLSEASREWFEICGRKDEFQGIVKLLVEFDERTGRHLRYGDPVTHMERKAIASGEVEKLRFFVRPMGGFVYLVIGELSRDLYRIVTSWMHEDGIRVERKDAALDHPVQKIVCVTDLVFSEGRKIAQEDI